MIIAKNMIHSTYSLLALLTEPSRSPSAFSQFVASYSQPLRSSHHSIVTRHMTSAYSGEPGDGTDGLEKIDYLPIQTIIKSGLIEVTPFQQEDWDVGMEHMNLIIREGQAWPFEEEFQTVDEYRGYFLSHAAFVVRALQPGIDVNGDEYSSGEVMGCFYVKPNFPGRCSHICNGGFITVPRFRRMGVAKVMGKSFLKLARDLGYRSSYFNLVFESNVASVRLWESLGFERVAVLKDAAQLKGVDGLDTAFGYRYDLTQLSHDFKV